MKMTREEYENKVIDKMTEAAINKDYESVTKYSLMLPLSQQFADTLKERFGIESSCTIHSDDDYDELCKIHNLDSTPEPSSVE